MLFCHCSIPRPLCSTSPTRLSNASDPDCSITTTYTILDDNSLLSAFIDEIHTSPTPMFREFDFALSFLFADA